MGSDFQITIVEKDKLRAEFLINLCVSEITRIENLISSWRKSSETSLINSNAGIKPVKVKRSFLI